MDLNAVCVISYVSLTEGLFRLTGIFMKGLLSFFFYRIWGVVPLCLDYPLTMSGLSSTAACGPRALSLDLPLTTLQYREPGAGSQEA